MEATAQWGELCRLLQDERAAYEALAALLEEEWSVLHAGQAQRVLDVVERKEIVLEKITALERERNACLRLLSGLDGSDELLPWLAASKLAQGIKARRALSELEIIGRRVKALGEKNAPLAARGLSVIRDAMQIVQEGLGGTPVYGESGQLTFTSSGTSMNVKG